MKLSIILGALGLVAGLASYPHWPIADSAESSDSLFALSAVYPSPQTENAPRAISESPGRRGASLVARLVVVVVCLPLPIGEDPECFGYLDLWRQSWC